MIRLIIQARMNSTRLPGKIAAPVEGVPLLGRVVERLRAVEDHLDRPFEVVVATSTARADDETQRLCEAIAVPCIRGPEDDVLARYLAATADLDDGDTALRATADNCLYCPRRASRIVQVHLDREADYTSIENLSYVVPEVIRVGALRSMEQRADTPYCREHVTPYFRNEANSYHIVKLPQTWQGLRPEIRLTVDTPAELQRTRWIYASLNRNLSLFSLEEVYELCDRHPERS